MGGGYHSSTSRSLSTHTSRSGSVERTKAPIRERVATESVRSSKDDKREQEFTKPSRTLRNPTSISRPADSKKVLKKSKKPQMYQTRNNSVLNTRTAKEQSPRPPPLSSSPPPPSTDKLSSELYMEHLQITQPETSPLPSATSRSSSHITTAYTPQDDSSIRSSKSATYATSASPLGSLMERPKSIKAEVKEEKVEVRSKRAVKKSPNQLASEVLQETRDRKIAASVVAKQSLTTLSEKEGGRGRAKSRFSSPLLRVNAKVSEVDVSIPAKNNAKSLNTTTARSRFNSSSTSSKERSTKSMTTYTARSISKEQDLSQLSATSFSDKSLTRLSKENVVQATEIDKNNNMVKVAVKNKATESDDLKQEPDIHTAVHTMDKQAVVTKKV